MTTIKAPIYQTLQIRELETLASERFQISGDTLMQRAGKAACDFLLRRWPHVQKIMVFCGSGNNGGDGYVLALLAHQKGLKVHIWQVGKSENLSSSAQKALDRCKEAGIAIEAFTENSELKRCDLIVDAICGIGLVTTLRADTLLVIERINRTNIPVLSIDIPTGINADTGQMLGGAIRAKATITFIGLKFGLLTATGIDCAGELVVSDLQLPPDLYASINPIAEKIQLNLYAHFLKPRAKDWHKGLSGHVLVVGGERGYTGAARMAAQAALRVGAGLVTIATVPDNANSMNMNCPELMCLGISHTHELVDLIKKATVIIVGPGLGQTPWSEMVWKFCCKQNLPLVVDADGLNLLAKSPRKNPHWILTPHPGEAARLLGESAEKIQADRLKALIAIQEKYQGVCVLKGAGSLIYGNDSLPALCDKGNPGMATAGMGDILSGVIGGLMAQGQSLINAAKIGVSLHAQAGDLAAKEGERGMIATDLLPFIRRLANP